MLSHKSTDKTFRTLQQMIFGENPKYSNPAADNLIQQVKSVMGTDVDNWDTKTLCDNLLTRMNSKNRLVSSFLRCVFLMEDDFSLSEHVRLGKYFVGLNVRPIPVFTCGCVYDTEFGLDLVRDWLKQEYPNTQIGIEKQFELLGVKDWEHELPEYMNRQYRNVEDRQIALIAMERSEQLLERMLPGQPYTDLLSNLSRLTTPAQTGVKFDVYAAHMSHILLRLCAIHGVRPTNSAWETSKYLVLKMPNAWASYWASFVADQLEKIGMGGVANV